MFQALLSPTSGKRERAARRSDLGLWSVNGEIKSVVLVFSSHTWPRIQISSLTRQTVNAILDSGSHLGSVVKMALI